MTHMGKSSNETRVVNGHLDIFGYPDFIPHPAVNYDSWISKF